MWHELARPQVHGYDLVGSSWLSPWTFASVADEKVTRIFEAPRGFVETIKKLGIRGVVESTVRTEEEPRAITMLTISFQEERPVAANVPPLGLSNKAVNEGLIFSLAVIVHHSYIVVLVAPAQLDSSRPDRRPFEGELAATTLWPEVEKVFGHGYEVTTHLYLWTCGTEYTF